MNPNRSLKIATRRSPLALWQANYVKARLETAHPGLQVELVTMTTKGDKILDAPLAKVGGKGLFVKELEQALLENRADIAVHSMKDVPVSFPEGLELAIICEREDPSDALVSESFNTFEELPHGARVGTSSYRRQCQVRHLRPDLEVGDLRGNVGTRLGKLEAGHFDAILLASAGLMRLEMSHRIKQRLSFETCLPAVGQGAIGIESRVGDGAVNELIKCLHHSQTAIRVQAERAMNNRLQGGCQVPIAAYAELQGEILILEGRVGTVDGTRLLKAQHRGSDANPEDLGISVAMDLLEQGADEILSALR